jgi:hypothetical protein
MTRIPRPAVLYIFQAGDTYTVSLETPTESPSVLAGTVSVSAEDRQDVLTALARVVGAGTPPGSFEPTALPSVGRLMYGLFLPRSIQDFLRSWEGPLTISTNDPAIPWELLHDGRAFLGIEHAVGRRLISGRTPPSRAGVQRERPTFLFVADPRGDLGGAAEEAQQLVATLSRRGFACDLLLAERASYLSVQEALGTGRYDVIHYAGHAHFGEDDGEESALELAQGRVLPASQIERVLRGAPLVFLNACSSAHADLEDTAPQPLTYLGAAAENLAAAFIFGGAQGFIGALWPVLDASSRRFAAFFYDRVLAGDPVGEALRATRHRLHQERPADPTWASFVLYGDPTYRLWAGPAKVEPKKMVVPAAPARRAGTVRSAPPPRISRAAPTRPQTPVQQRDSRLRLVAGVFVLLIVAGLLSALGWWAYSRKSGTSRQGPAATPVALAVAVRTLTPTASVTPSSIAAATSTPHPPTSTSTAAPTVSPTAQPTMTPTVVQPPRGRLAFVSKVAPEKSTLYVMQADGSGLQALGLGVDPDWSPAGDRIAFAGLLEDEPGIHLINADGSGRTRLTDASDWQPTWSPDGKHLAFMSLRDGNREIYVVNADGSGLRRISNNPWQDKHPSWSPAGDRIAFISNRSGRWQVWVMNADGSQQIRLTDNDYDNFRPVWSPDGRQIAYGVWTGIRNEIWVMDADGSKPQMVTANAVYKQEFAGYGLAWSPNRFISFVSNRAGQPQVYAMNPDGSGQTAVTDMPAGAFSPAWSGR